MATLSIYLFHSFVKKEKERRRNRNMKRILTIQDISCFGKCSLTVALPLLSSMGIETAILPTAVLSTHTLFKGFTCKDLSDQLKPITTLSSLPA